MRRWHIVEMAYDFFFGWMKRKDLKCIEQLKTELAAQHQEAEKLRMRLIERFNELYKTEEQRLLDEASSNLTVKEMVNNKSALATWLTDPNPATRRWALTTLSIYQDQIELSSLEPVLMEMAFGDPNEEVKYQAIIALAVVVASGNNSNQARLLGEKLAGLILDSKEGLSIRKAAYRALGVLHRLLLPQDTSHATIYDGISTSIKSFEKLVESLAEPTSLSEESVRNLINS